MNTASLDRCRRLYEVSGWEASYDEQPWWIINGGETKATVFNPTQRLDYTFSGNKEVCPAYDLDFLFSKLIEAGSFEVRYVSPSNPLSMDLKEWYGKCIACTPEMRQKDYPVAGLPVDAAIELFKQGILTKAKQ